MKFFQAEDGIRDVERSRGLGDVYKRQAKDQQVSMSNEKQKWEEKPKEGENTLSNKPQRGSDEKL